jgi:hypothetical protein
VSLAIHPPSVPPGSADVIVRALRHRRVTRLGATQKLARVDVTSRDMVAVSSRAGDVSVRLDATSGADADQRFSAARAVSGGSTAPATRCSST